MVVSREEMVVSREELVVSREEMEVSEEKQRWAERRGGEGGKCMWSRQKCRRAKKKWSKVGRNLREFRESGGDREVSGR
jgi:hypothetical protein